MVAQNTEALRRALARMSAVPEPGDLPAPAHARCRRGRAAAHDRSRNRAGCAARRNSPIRRSSASSGRTRSAPGEPGGRDALHLLLQRMSQGGIYDHLGGGYARYATDAVWLVPHFEKMLYDNAQLLELLAFAQADRPDPLYAARAAETVGWMLRDMPRRGGAFAASEDADSEGEEGRFYVWTEAEIDALLGADAPAFKPAYDVTAAGNWEGHTILRRVTPPGDAAREAVLARARAVLFAARARGCGRGATTRCWPTGTGWRSRRWPAPARCSRGPTGWRAPRRRSTAMLAGSRRRGRAGGACLAARAGRPRRGCSTTRRRWRARRWRCSRRRARRRGWRRRSAWRTRRWTWFGDGAGGVFTTAVDAADVPLARPRTAADNATPAGGGAARGGVRPAVPSDRGRCLAGARRGAAAGLLRGAANRPPAMPTLLAAAICWRNAATVVIAGPPGHPLDRGVAGRAALAAPDPAVVVLRAPAPDALPAGHPAAGKGPGAAGAAAYVCRGGVCGLPVSDPAALRLSLMARIP